MTIGNSARIDPLQKIVIHSCNDPINCACEGLEKVDTFKYLGIQIDSNLSWKDHINFLYDRLKKFSSSFL